VPDLRAPGAPGDAARVTRLLFLHGAGLTSAMWAPQLDALAGAHDVAAIDLPGHGKRADERFTFEGATDVVLDALGDGRPALLVGLSLGGYVSILMGANHPERTAGLVLTGCSVDYSRRGDRIVATAGEAFQRVWPKRMLREAQRSAFRKRYPTVTELGESEQYWRGYADALHQARKVHWHELLTGYECPVRVLNGANDKPHVRDQGKLIAGVPDGRAQVIEGAGHLANLDAPEAYTAAVREVAAAVG
jgi:pimeloyl-ACP methyl ester carboxylesterase